MKINILGTEYKIKYNSDEEIAEYMGAKPGDYSGYCNGLGKK